MEVLIKSPADRHQHQLATHPPHSASPNDSPPADITCSHNAGASSKAAEALAAKRLEVACLQEQGLEAEASVAQHKAKQLLAKLTASLRQQELKVGARAALQGAKQLVAKCEAQEARPPGANGWSSARAPDLTWAAYEGAVPAKATAAKATAGEGVKAARAGQASADKRSVRMMQES